MHKSSLIKVLKSLSLKELKQLERFVCSPFYNRQKNVTMLFEVLKKKYPLFSGSALKKERIFKKLYPNESYNDAKHRNLVSDLLNLILKFLAITKIESEENLINLSLTEELLDRNIENLFVKNHQKLSGIVEKIKIKDVNYYAMKLKIYELYSPYLERRKRNFERIDKNEQEKADCIFNGFLASILPSYAFMANQKKTLLKHNFNLPLFDDVMEYLENHEEDYEKIPYINIHHTLVLLLLKQEDKYYYKLKKLFQTKHNSIKRQNLRNLCTILINYCQYQIYKSREEFHKEVFELDKEIYKKKVFQKGDTFLPVSFNNKIIHSLNLGEFDWCKKFIDYYKNILPKPYRASSYNHGMALLEFEKKNYGKTLEYLARVKTEEFSYKLDIKQLQLKIFYEQNETESLLSLIDSYRHLLGKAKRLAENFKKFHMNFINYSEKLIRIRENTHINQLEKLKKEVSGPNIPTGKTWLLKKIDELNC